MKRLINFLLIFVVMFFIGCSKTEISTESNIENVVAYNLEQFDKDKNLDDETLKTLSVIIRTNLETESMNKSQKYTVSEKYQNISNQTKNEIIMINENIEYIDISGNNNKWNQTIEKDEILSYAHENNINLSNISEVEPIFKDDIISHIKIGGKSFDYRNFAKKFNIPSNKIEDIKSTNQNIEIIGSGNGFVKNFELDEVKTLSNQGNDYINIINKIYPDSKIIK